MEIGTVTRHVISKGRKQKMDSASKRMRDTVMVVYKTHLGGGKYSSQTRHELV